MNRIGLFLSILAAIPVLVACSSGNANNPTGGSGTIPSSANAAPPANLVAAGQKLYEADCAACHGTNGAGGLKLGQITVPDIRASVLANVYKNDISLIKRSIFDGKDEVGKDLDATMPRWNGKLSDTEVAAVIQYLQTLK